MKSINQIRKLASAPIASVSFLDVRLAMICVGFLTIGFSVNLSAQEVRCDPNKVMTAENCAKCHTNEVAVWKQTPHSQTFEQLSRDPAAKAICKNLGLRSVKRSDVCIKCHFTTKNVNGRIKAVSGVSCESCHGAAQDWIGTHNDYGGPSATKETETDAHAIERYQTSASLGMRNTRDLYAIASSCFNCHTVPDESLVNVGGHNAGSQDFELVRWSQGKVRHNFLRGDGVNRGASQERLRLMLVVGLIADLEYSTRATAAATSKSNYGVTVAQRAAKVAVRLFEVQQKIDDANVQMALDAFSGAELRTNNQASLEAIAAQIRNAGRMFATENDGSALAAVDSLLPPPSEYK
jgi:ribosomal protein L40E